MGRRALSCLPTTQTLRSEVLGVPLLGEDGSRLKHVSPRQVRLSKKFAKILAEIETILEAKPSRRSEDRNSRPCKKRPRNLDEALELFLQLSYDPGRPGKANPWLESDFVGMQKSWERFAQALSQHPA